MASHSHREGHQQSQDHEHGHRHAEEDMLSVEEAFRAATWQSAITLNIHHKVGSLEVGKNADLVIWDLERLIEIPYFTSDVPIYKVIKSGRCF